jgi:hypothetical protein
LIHLFYCFQLTHIVKGYLRDQNAQGKGSGGFWTTDYYQQYFDVDTQTVLKRCYTTLIPTEARTYISTHLNPPDLYGPFWTLTTLIFTLFLSSSLAASISAYLSPGVEYDYNWTLLSIAVIIVYAYGLALPVLLWLALRYIGVGEWSVIEAMAVWGYAQFVWIPVSVSYVYLVVVLWSDHWGCRSSVCFRCPSFVGHLWALRLASRAGSLGLTSIQSWRPYVFINGNVDLT